MNFIAVHIDAISFLAFVAFAGVICMLYGIRGMREQKRGGTSVP